MVMFKAFDTIRERVLLRIVFCIQWIYILYPVYLCNITHLFPVLLVLLSVLMLHQMEQEK